MLYLNFYFFRSNSFESNAENPLVISVEEILPQQFPLNSTYSVSNPLFGNPPSRKTSANAASNYNVMPPSNYDLLSIFFLI